MLHLQPSLTWKSKWLSALQVVSIALSLLAGQNSGVVVEATFSIAAIDTATKQIGAAGASCVPNSSIYEFLYQGVPGHGVLITQAKFAVPGTAVYQIGEAMLLNGTDPALIIEAITDPSVDDAVVSFLNCDNSKNVTYDEYKLRQYGVVDLMGRAAGTQANICTNKTVPALAKNFVGQDEEFGCDLADRLYRAITSVPLMLQEAMETDDQSLAAGDVRCFPIGTVATGMFLHIDNPDGTQLVHIDIIADVDDPNPFPAFQKQYQAWRSNNSCPGNGSSTEAPSSDAGETLGTESPTRKPSSGTSGMLSTRAAMWALVLVLLAVQLFP